MKKDPAFLLYSKDWLQGTAEMTHVEKGVYIDLLCHQHQNGSLPADVKRLSRIVGMSMSEFKDVWQSLADKFPAIEGASATPNAIAIEGANAVANAIANDGANAIANASRIANRKLIAVMNERSDRAHKNQVIGIWSKILRELDFSAADIKSIRKDFKLNDFLNLPIDEVANAMSEWVSDRYSDRYPSLEDGNGNEDGNEDEDGKIKGGVGEKRKPKPSVKVQMNDPVFIPEGWPQDFATRWKKHRLYRHVQHKFQFMDSSTEQSAIQRLYSESEGDYNLAVEAIQFCEEKGWKGVIVSAYKKYKISLDVGTRSGETHKKFSTTVVRA